MNPTTVVESWVENKAKLLQGLIDAERKRIEIRDGVDGMFAGMEKSTDEIQWRAQLRLLEEFQEFYDSIPGKA